jgi:predicted ester cyclase
VTHPDAPFHGKAEVGAVYSSIIDAIPDVALTSVKRFTGEEGRYVVDESVLSGHVHGDWAGTNGDGAPVEVRVLHIFEVRDGLISFENAWFDAANVQRQIEAWKTSQRDV